MIKTESVKARIGVAMRIYLDNNNTELISVICNRCGKEMKVENGILKEGCFEVKHAFGYFSSKDGQVYHFDLCEQCFDKMLAEFRVRMGYKSKLGKGSYVAVWSNKTLC